MKGEACGNVPTGGLLLANSAAMAAATSWGAGVASTQRKAGSPRNQDSWLWHSCRVADCISCTIPTCTVRECSCEAGPKN